MAAMASGLDIMDGKKHYMQRTLGFGYEHGATAVVLPINPAVDEVMSQEDIWFAFFF